MIRNENVKALDSFSLVCLHYCISIGEEVKAWHVETAMLGWDGEIVHSPPLSLLNTHTTSILHMPICPTPLDFYYLRLFFISK